MATEPSLVAGREESEPSRAPMGVRATPTTHTSLGFRPSGPLPAPVLAGGAMAWWLASMGLLRMLD
jgi:hypothetical protein